MTQNGLFCIPVKSRHVAVHAVAGVEGCAAELAGVDPGPGEVLIL